MVYAKIQRYCPLPLNGRTRTSQHRLAGPSVAEQHESLGILEHPVAHLIVADPIDPLPGILASLPEDTDTFQIFEEPGGPATGEHIRLTPRYVIVAEQVPFAVVRVALVDPVVSAIYGAATYRLTRMGRREVLLADASEKDLGDRLLLVSPDWRTFVAQRLDGTRGGALPPLP